MEDLFKEFGSMYHIKFYGCILMHLELKLMSILLEVILNSM